MKSFLREYWLWILVPFMVVAMGLAVFFFFVANDSGGSSPFIYNVGG
ncbi:MAG: hypothetical protein ABL998_23940 [Planctomycetota bacterium]